MANAFRGESRQGVPAVAAAPTVALTGASTTMHIGGTGPGPLADAIPSSRSSSGGRGRSSGGRGRSSSRHHHRGPGLVGATAAQV